jgi:ketopantoate reductase
MGLERRAQAFQVLAQNAGLNMQLSANPHQDVWWKLVGAAAGMSATCLSRRPLRACAEAENTRHHMIEIMHEVWNCRPTASIASSPSARLWILSGRPPC